MMFNKVWKRYLFSELLKIFTLFILCFYSLYILIDYSLHASHFSKIKDLHYLDVLYYYFYLIIKRLDLVFPLALVVSLNKVLLRLNQSNELLSLSVGGLNRKQILMPFFSLASCLCMLLFINFEYCIPSSLDYLENFENQNFKRKTSDNYEKRSAYGLTLGDGSKLLFSRYNSHNQMFEDVFYIPTSSDIWKMETLSLQAQEPEGFHVEHLIKNEKAILTLESSYEKKSFPYLVVDFSIRKNAILPFEQHSLSSLYSLIRGNSSFYKIHAPQVQTQLYVKLFTPFISFLVILAIAPFCMIFSRRLPIFLLYAMSIFGLITFFTILDAAVIIGENNLFPPIIAITAPFICSAVGFSWNFIKNNAS